MQVKWPLVEVNLNTVEDLKITYVSGLLKDNLGNDIVDLHYEFNDCFTWIYKDMLGLRRSLVEYRLPIKL